MTGWETIREELLRRIRARDWLPGANIPGEEALAIEFGVARATMNRALRDLADAGVLERRRKAGTRVALHPARRARFDIPVIRLEVEAGGKVHGLRLLHQALEPVPANIAHRLRLPASSRFWHLQTLHLANEAPLLVEDRWLSPHVLPDPPPDFAALSANEWLVVNVPLDTGSIDFSAANATLAEANLLGTAPGAALFVVERMTWTNEQAVTHVRLAYAPGYRVHTLL